MERRAVKYKEYPEPLEMADYEAATRQFIEHAMRHPDARAVYRYGTLRNPGISDLDFVVVFPERVQDQGVFSSIKQAPEEVLHLVGRGNIMFMNEDSFRRIHYIDPGLQLKLLAGREYEFFHPTEAQWAFRQTASVLDWLPERVWRILRAQEEEVLFVTHTLVRLRSLSHSFQNVTAMVALPAADRFCQKLDELRAVWFSLSQTEQQRSLLAMMREAVDAGKETLAAWFSSMVPDIHISCGFQTGEVAYLPGLRYVSSREFAVRREAEELRFHMPCRWFDHYRFYAQQEGALGSSIRAISREIGESTRCLTSEYQSFLAEKYAACNSNFAWALRHNLGLGGSFRFGFLLPRLLPSVP